MLPPEPYNDKILLDLYVFNECVNSISLEKDVINVFLKKDENR